MVTCRQEAGSCRRRTERVAGHGRADDVQGCSGVAHGTGEHSSTHQAGAIHSEWPGRDPSPAGFEADDPAARGGNANRAASVGALGDRDLAVTDGGGRPAGGSAGHACEVPRGGCGRASSRFGVAGQAELRGGGGADRHGPGSLEQGDDAIVGLAGVSADGAAAKVARRSGQGVEILDRAGHPEQRPGLHLARVKLALHFVGGVAGPLVVDPAPGVAFVGVGPVQGVLDDLDHARLAGADGRCGF